MTNETLVPIDEVHVISDRDSLSGTSFSHVPKEGPSAKKQWTSTIDTQALVDALSLQFTVTQAEALVVIMQDIIGEKLSIEIIAKQQVETDSQMLKARCHEIRLDLQIQQSKNATAREALHEKCTNEIQSTIERLRDAVDMLQSDARMRLSLFKSENREELSKIDSFIHKGNSRLTLQMSDVKTFVEGVKVRLMFMFTTFLILALLILVLEKNIRKRTLSDGTSNAELSRPEHNTFSGLNEPSSQSDVLL